MGISRLDLDFDPSPYLKDEDAAVRRSAGEAILERRGSGACEALIELAFGHGGADRGEAAKLLAKADRARANAVLVEKLSNGCTGLDRRIAIEVLAEVNACRD